MLSDNGRKILRIMFAFRQQMRYMPDMTELKRRSSRTPVQINAALLELAKAEYIKWKDGRPPETAIIIEAWEHDGPQAKPHRRGGSSGADYFTQY